MSPWKTRLWPGFLLSAALLLWAGALLGAWWTVDADYQEGADQLMLARPFASGQLVSPWWYATVTGVLWAVTLVLLAWRARQEADTALRFRLQSVVFAIVTPLFAVATLLQEWLAWPGPDGLWLSEGRCWDPGDCVTWTSRPGSGGSSLGRRYPRRVLTSFAP